MRELVKQLVPVVAVTALGGLISGAVQGNALLALLVGVVTAVLAVVVYRWAVRWSERRDPVEVGRDGAAGAAVRGLLIGTGMFVAVIANIAFLGGYRIEGLGSLSGAVGLIGLMAAASVTEELIFRGILFRIVERRIGTWLALALTGTLFGLMHLGNANASLWGAIAIAIEAGGMLAAAYAATRTLWLPIGLHFGWNFAAAGIFGAQVSGTGEPQGLLEGVTSGHVLITGGEFGPEGSLYSIVFGLALTFVFMRLAKRRGNVVPLRRRTAATLPR